MSEQPEHAGPVFAVYQGEAMHLFAAMDSVDLRGIPCVKGTALRANKEDWRAGLIIYVPTSTVTRIIEYPSLENYRQIIASHYARKAEA